MKQESTIQITAAVQYLAIKNPAALQDLRKPMPNVLGRTLCLWLPTRISTLAFDLPPLAKGARL